MLSRKLNGESLAARTKKTDHELPLVIGSGVHETCKGVQTDRVNYIAPVLIASAENNFLETRRANILALPLLTRILKRLNHRSPGDGGKRFEAELDARYIGALHRHPMRL